MQDIFLYLTLGLGIGILSGFFGIGGGFILTPVLLLLSFNPVIAIATSLLYTIATSLSGAFAHYRLKQIKWKPALMIGMSGVVATQIAHPFVILLEDLHVEDTVVPLMYIVLISYFSFTLLWNPKKGKNLVRNDSKSKPHLIFKAIMIGLFAGFISTTLGVGGGFIIVPLTLSILSFSPKEAVGTSLFSVFMIVLAGFTSYAFTTPLNYEISGILTIGAIIGGQLGALSTKGYPNKQIQHFLAGLYIATGLSLILKLFNLDTLGFLLLSIYCIFLLIHFLIHSLRIWMFMKKKSKFHKEKRKHLV